MGKIIRKIMLFTLVISIGFTLTNTQTNKNEYAKKVILLLFNLKANATAKDLCNELQKAAQNELELRKRKGESGVLAPDDPNHLWINECKKEDLTMDSVLEMLNLANQLLKKQ